MNRSKKLKKNIIYSIGLTCLNLGISFLMYPLLIKLLGVSNYGCWLTISSIATWMTFFEFGLGTGLKNQLGKAIANNNYTEAKELVSTAYFTIGCIVCMLFIVFFLVRNTIDWASLLNTTINKSTLDSFVSIMVFTYFIVFFLKLLGNVASANQEPFIEKLITSCVQVACFIVVLLLTYLHINNILVLSIYWGVSTVVVWIAFSVCLYLKRYKLYLPSLKKINYNRFTPLLDLGFKFFIIQLSIIVITGSTNFIISKYISSSEVVTYNATYKLFSLAQVLYAIIVAPTWPAFIDAIEKKDYNWIKRIVRKMIRIWVIITLVMLVVLICSPVIFDLWLGQQVNIPFKLSVLLFIYFTSMSFGGIFNMYVNASGKLKLQMTSWILIAIIYIPFVIFLIKQFNLGIYAVAIGLLLSNMYYLIIAPFQYKIYINRSQNVSIP